MPNPAPRPDLSKYRWLVSRTDSVKLNGNICQVVGVVVESVGPASRIGEVCKIDVGRDKSPIPAEVVGFRDNRVLLMPLGDMGDIAHGSEVVATGRCLTIPVGQDLLGRVLDGMGRPIDDKGILLGEQERPVYQTPPHPLHRQRITEPLTFGVKAIDGLLTCGRGQRIGIFSGSGVGKSTLLGMIARNDAADVNVIALIGERGREVREFIEGNLGPQGMKRSVVVVATSDQPAVQRLKGALTATTIAEYFRDLGCNVMFMMDSITRLAWAQREIGLAIGEPPTARGYTPSVFALLPKLLERAGSGAKGTITGLYTILVEGDDMNEPVADTVRSILDGHIVLSRDLASKSHYPAIDVLLSVSRLMPQITTQDHQRAAARLRRVLSVYSEAEDLINIGAYSSGSSQSIDEACSLIGKVRDFLTQKPGDVCPWQDTISELCGLAGSGAP
jgi:flagellum-specific ATP synthase